MRHLLNIFINILRRHNLILNSVHPGFQKMTKERRDELQVEELPRTLGAATAELEKDELLISVLGKELAEKIIKANKKEYKEYCMQVTDWEINHYLYRL